MFPYNLHLESSFNWFRLIVTCVFLLVISGPLVSSKKTSYNPPDLSQLRRNFFDNKLSFVTVGSIWVFFLIIFIVFRLYYLDERSKLHQVFDDCSPSTAQFKYLIRLRIGKSSSIFQKETSAIMVDLLDARQCFITRLSVSPSWLKADVYSRQSEKPRLRSLRFILNRANQLPTIGSIRLAHDSYFPVGGYIFLHSLEIRNIIENTLTQIPVFKRIYVLPPDANELDQVFHAHHHFADKKKDEITSGYAPHLTFSETLLFIFFYSNTTLFTTIFSPSYMEISSLTEAAYNGLIGIIPSSTFTAMFLILYRFIVKNSYAKSKAIGSWSVVRIIFLTTLTANGLIIGLTSSYIQSRQTPHTLTYWSLSILISNFSLGALILPLIVIRFIIDSLIVYRSSQKLASTPSLASKVVDETKPDDRQSSIIGSLLRIKRRTGSNKGLESMVDEHSKSKISKTGQHVSKNDDDMEENSKLEKMVIQKRSMEEGLSETPETGNIKSPRVRIMSRIHGVLGRPSKEPRSQEEEKIFDIDKRIEDQSHRD